MFGRAILEEMLKRSPYKKRQPKDTLPITDFYTTNEIKEKFGVKDSWIFHIAKEHNIPRTFNRGKTYWSKKHFDDYFAKKDQQFKVSIGGTNIVIFLWILIDFSGSCVILLYTDTSQIGCFP